MLSLFCSEHSRHWFFRGRMIIDGEEQKETLFSLIMGTQHHSNQNNVIKFCDNSRLDASPWVSNHLNSIWAECLKMSFLCVCSGIKGMDLECMYPTNPAQASLYKTRHATRHVIFTAETHNFPTGLILITFNLLTFFSTCKGQPKIILLRIKIVFTDSVNNKQNINYS